jgi:hypothetical protein
MSTYSEMPVKKPLRCNDRVTIFTITNARCSPFHAVITTEMAWLLLLKGISPTRPPPIVTA